MDASVHIFGWVTCNSPVRIILDISAGTLYTDLYLKSVYHVLTSLHDVTNNPIASKHQNWDDLYERTWGVYFDLCKLRDEGFIEFDLPRKPGKLPLGQLNIVKLKSIPLDWKTK